MADSISLLQLRTDLSGVLRRVSEGESLVVTRFGIPVAVIRPHSGSDAEVQWLTEERARLVKRLGANHVDVRRITEKIKELSS